MKTDILKKHKVGNKFCEYRSVPSKV